MGTATAQALREIDEIHGTNYAPLVDESIAGDIRADWCEAEDEDPRGIRQGAVAKRLFALGLTIGEAARFLGVHPLVIAKCLAHDPRRAQQILAVEQLLRDGHHPCEIERMVNVPNATVYRIAGWLNIDKAPKRGLTVEQQTVIRRMRADGKGYAEIAEATGILRNTVKSWCRRNGLGCQS